MTLEAVHLEDFDLAGPLGRGATAQVLAARHRASGFPVAIKMLEPAHHDSAELRARLHREALILATVRSPHVATVLGFGYHGEHPFVVLEQLAGETLGERVKRDGRLGFPALAEMAEQLILGVRDCHAASIVHRDIKPSNIFLARDLRPAFPPLPPPPPDPLAPFTVKLIDFGVARLEALSQAGQSLTTTQHLLGSMGYMAPEQFQHARAAGPSADLYAVGSVLFRSVAGRLPFVSRSFDTLVRLKLEGAPPILSSMPGVKKRPLLDAFVGRALEADPARRFASANAMLEAWWRVAAAYGDDVDDLPAGGRVSVG